MFVSKLGFTLTEHNPDKPWIVVGRQHCTVELDEGQNFFEWARDRWPAPRRTVELDPWAPSLG
jgi:hypothetical protein